MNPAHDTSVTLLEKTGAYCRTHWHDLALALLCLAFALVASQSLHTLLLYTPDSADYLGWAQSLSRFQGFRLPFDVEPGLYVSNAPLYALLLTPLEWLFPLNVIAAKTLSLALGIVLLGLFYRYTSGNTSKGIALLACLFVAVHPLFLLYATQVLSEVPFMAAVFLCLLLADRLLAAERQEWTEVAGFGLLLGLVILLRELGITLVVAIVLVLFAKKRPRDAWLLLGVAAFVYLLWYLRNEGFVGAAEKPGLSNTALFFGHLFTDQSASLAGEFRSRLLSNASFYGRQAAGLPFLSQYIGTGYTVVRGDEPAISFVRALVNAWSVPCIALTGAIILAGLRRMLKESPSGVILLIWSCLYAAAILLYPVADARFLFPLLFPALLACAHGAASFLDLTRNRKAEVRNSILAGGILLAALLLVPHTVWTENYLRVSRAFKEDPVALNATFSGSAKYPSAFGQLFPQAAAWIDARSPDSALVLCQRREIALWLKGRKVMRMAPAVSVRDFENIVRDYRPAFIVNYLASRSWGDFDYYLGSSRRWKFEPVFRAGDVEVLQPTKDAGGVSREAGTPDSAGSARTRYLHAVRLLQEGSADTAMQLLSKWRHADLAPMFSYAIAAEFAGRFQEAEETFRQIRTMTQAWPYLVHARRHLEILRLLEGAGADGEESARRYRSAAILTWQEGFRQQAIRLLRRSLDAFPQDIPALAYGILLHYEDGTLRSADSLFEELKTLSPEDGTVRNWESILSAEKRIDNGESVPDVSRDRLANARAFLSMGLVEHAIDQVDSMLEADPGNAEGWKLLAGIYAAQGRSAPARAALGRLRAIDSAPYSP